MEYAFSVGDEVTIRSGLTEEFRPVTADGKRCGFLPPMAHYRGQAAVITWVSNVIDSYYPRYRINLDDGEWWWCDEFLEPPDNVPGNVEVDVSDWL